MLYIKSLPINDTPEIFGLHDNANITFAQNETFSLLNSITLLQPRASSGGSTSREDVSSLYKLCMYVYSVETLLKDPLNEEQNTFNLSIKDNPLILVNRTFRRP